MSAVHTAGPLLCVGLTTFRKEAGDAGRWRRLLSDVRLYDEGGVDRVVCSDHVVFGERLEEYGRPELGGLEGGVQPTGPDGEWLEPITLLSVIAGQTTRVRLGTNILLGAVRRPVILAKTLSTLDVLSGGRLDIGVGVGWQREEYEAAGLRFEERGRLLDHSLEVCQVLWSEQRASYNSHELSFQHIHMMPKPLQPGGVPIWVSGRAPGPSMRRLARFGAGWIPWAESATDLVAGIAAMRRAVEAEGRDPVGLGIVGSLAWVRDAEGRPDVRKTMVEASRLVEAGVTVVQVRLPLPRDRGEALETVRDAVAEFRRAVGRADTLA